MSKFIFSRKDSLSLIKLLRQILFSSDKTDGENSEVLSELLKKANITSDTPSTAEWGTIIGTLTEQVDLVEYITSSKRSLFIDLWNQAAGQYGTYNQQTGFFELNGLTDITYEQALAIYNRTAHMNGIADYKLTASIGGYNYPIRTNLPANFWSTTDFSAYISDMEVVNVRPYSQFNYQGLIVSAGFEPSAFYNCSKMREVQGILDIRNMQAKTYSYPIPLLETVLFKSLKVDFSMLGQAPKISLESLQYLVDNAANTAAITVTLHADAYARLTQDLIDAATAKNITFVSA